MNEILFLVEQAQEGGYTARALGHSIVTEADSLAELRGMVHDAVHCHFDAVNTPYGHLGNTDPDIHKRPFWLSINTLNSRPNVAMR